MYSAMTQFYYLKNAGLKFFFEMLLRNIYKFTLICNVIMMLYTVSRKKWTPK